MDRWGRGWHRVQRFADHPDPLVVASNWIALIVASNQPLYPLYVQWVAGGGGMAAMLTWLSTPFFACAPIVARRNSALGRAMLPLAGIFNSLLALSLFGADAGLTLFLAPCLVLAGLCFRTDERSWSYGIVALAIAGYACVVGLIGQPIVPLTQSAAAALYEVNLISAACLLILIGMTFSGATKSPDGHRPG
ncbi:hypothetical protein SAMN02745157_4055 [Kaistia soli DSM 19436]|uniref:Uncharacterized protein n=2 Tax=Kaistia TaxID=166953 RepID=A0A1M5IZL0_9HYPH|nr:hypothetical protein SAMN02745157_4055 [Kaistia soli DSM 19436]